MEINLITFASSLTQPQTLLSEHQQMLTAIEQKFKVNYLSPSDLAETPTTAPTYVFVASGGVEQMVVQAMDRLPAYVLLLADGLKNSLAASLEILSWMKANGRRGHVIHGTPQDIADEVERTAAACQTLQSLQQQRVGVVGTPSSWLIASGVDYPRLQQRWGVAVEEIDLCEVVDAFRSISPDAQETLASDLERQAERSVEPTHADLIEALRLYQAVKSVVKNHNLNAFTLNCFDLIPLTKTTGCIALALLNQEGIPAGCEGDMQTLLTMLLAQTATGQPTFMANPSTIVNHQTHEIILAHCTIAPSMTDRFVLRSHFESLSGVAIEGHLRPAPITLLKCGGRDMANYFLTEGRLIKTDDHPQRCRTQMHLQLDAPLDYFLHQSIGNHHVLLRGHQAKLLRPALEMLGATAVE